MPQFTVWGALSWIALTVLGVFLAEATKDAYKAMKGNRYLLRFFWWLLMAICALLWLAFGLRFHEPVTGTDVRRAVVAGILVSMSYVAMLFETMRALLDKRTASNHSSSTA